MNAWKFTRKLEDEMCNEDMEDYQPSHQLDPTHNVCFQEVAGGGMFFHPRQYQLQTAVSVLNPQPSMVYSSVTS